MNGWKLAAKAINDGVKIRRASWKLGEYIHFNSSIWLCQDGNQYYPNFSDVGWQIYKEPAPKVTWYRPYIVWYRHKSEPEKFNGSNLFNRYKDVNEWTNARVVRVLEWEEREFPATYDECEDVTDG